MSNADITSNLVAASSEADNAARPHRFARWCRTRIIKQLAQLEHGCLSVSDPFGSWSVGQNGPFDAHLEVSDPAFYIDVALEGSLGAARSWTDGHWHTTDLTQVLKLLVRNIDTVDAMEGGLASLANVVARARHWINRNSRSGSARNIHAHYDLGNELFVLFLDDSMTYSSGIFPTPDASLEAAQFEKLDRICRKLKLTPEDRVVEIGTGWGSFAMHAARNYGCRVTTTTISAEQHAMAIERIELAGLSRLIDVRLTDYRDLEGQYDKLVSIEMIEAVGHQFLPTYFAKCAALLKPEGAMLIQAITMPDQRYAQYLRSSDFIRAMVFPGSCCPALTAVLDAVKENTDLRLSHQEDIGLHYARTLRLWRERFDDVVDDVRVLGYHEEFIRLWRFYLSYCEAGMEERYTGTSQLLLQKPFSRLSGNH